MTMLTRGQFSFQDRMGETMEGAEEIRSRNECRMVYFYISKSICSHELYYKAFTKRSTM